MNTFKILTIGAGLGLCSVALPVQAQNLAVEWVKQVTGKSSDYCQSVDIDALGNVYVAGHSNTSPMIFPKADKDTIKIPGKGGIDAFIFKTDATGNTLWAKGFGSSKTENSNGITVDKHGYVYATGIVGESLEFDPGNAGTQYQIKGGNDIFLVKYDTAGKFIWAKGMGDTKADAGWSVTTDNWGNVYLAGSFTGTVDFNPGGTSKQLISSATNGFIAKYTPDGQLLWVSQVNGGESIAYSVAVDDEGAAYICGYFKSAVSLLPAQNTISLTAVGTQDMFIAKLDSSGNFLWGTRLGGPGAQNAYSIAIDTLKQVYIGGSFSDTLKPDGLPNVASFVAGKGDFFTARLSQDGKVNWIYSGGGAENDYGEEVTVDEAGNVYLIGFFSRTAYFTADTVNSKLVARGTGSSSDGYIVKLRNDGSFVWVKQIGGDGIEQLNDIKVMASGTIYLSGQFRSANANFDPDGPGNPLYTADGADGFVVKYMCTDTNSSVLPIATCDKEIIFRRQTFTESGEYPIVIRNMEGCDSTIMLQLTFNVPEKPVVTVDKLVLGTSRSYNTYQWLLNEQPIEGATDRNFTVSVNGFYKVVITDENGCTDTSEVYEVTNATSIAGGPDKVAEQISIYPNPAEDVLHIKSPVSVHISVTGMDGRVLKQSRQASSLNIRDLSEGIYLIKITDRNDNLLKVEKLVKAK